MWVFLLWIFFLKHEQIKKLYYSQAKNIKPYTKFIYICFLSKVETKPKFIAYAHEQGSFRALIWIASQDHVVNEKGFPFRESNQAKVEIASNIRRI